jgi:hypothetical protein
MPTRKFLGLATNNGFCALSFFFLRADAVVTTFFVFVSFFGYTFPHHPLPSLSLFLIIFPYHYHPIIAATPGPAPPDPLSNIPDCGCP